MINEEKERERQMIEDCFTDNYTDVDGKPLKELVEKYGGNSVIYIDNGYYSDGSVDFSIVGKVLETDAQYEERMRKLEKRLEAQRKRIELANSPKEITKKQKQKEELNKRTLEEIENTEKYLQTLKKKIKL